MSIYKVNEYVSLLRKNGILVNNLFGVNISMPKAVSGIIVSKEKKIGYIEGDENRNITKASGGGIFSTKGVGAIRSGISTVTGKVSTGNFGGDRTKLYKGLQSIGTALAQPIESLSMVEMLCTSAQMPFYNMKMDKSFYNHYTHKFVTGVDTDAVQLTFYLDREYSFVYEFFVRWMLVMVRQQESKQVGWVNYKNMYQSEIEVFTLNKSSGGVRQDAGLLGINQSGLLKMNTATLKGAFPIKIDSLQLKSGATELLELKVTFEYDTIDYKYKVDIRKQSDLNLTGAKLNDLSIIDRKNMANQVLSQAKDLANNVVYEAKTIVAQVHEVKKTIQSTKDSVKNLPKAVKSEVKDIKDEAKKAVRF